MAVGVHVGGRVGSAMAIGVGMIGGLNGLNATRGLMKIIAIAITATAVSVATTSVAI